MLIHLLEAMQLQQAPATLEAWLAPWVVPVPSRLLTNRQAPEEEVVEVMVEVVVVVVKMVVVVAQVPELVVVEVTKVVVAIKQEQEVVAAPEAAAAVLVVEVVEDFLHLEVLVLVVLDKVVWGIMTLLSDSLEKQ